MSVEKKLESLGLSLPKPPKPVAAYIPAVKTGNVIFISGQIPVVEGKVRYKGKVGQDISVEEGYEAAKICALNALSIIKDIVGSLDKVKRIVRIVGYVNCTEDFEEPHKVVNGASEFLVKIFGEKGRHARLALGSNALPLGAAIELEMIVEVEE
ncbi:MAG: RidA family protein [Candidatus Baldrarchaeia archaeon]